MGSSSKKKLEKKKDFQKPKLKVGKVKPKAANQTDTNFRSKAIILNQQSIRIDAPDFSQQIQHHISLLSSRSDSQRKESLAFLTSATLAHSEATNLSLPTATLLEKCCPLLLDGSQGVRQQVQKLMQALPNEEIQDHVVKILPFVRAAITHLSSDIRKTALENLSWLLLTAGDEVVSCPGGWPKTIESCVTLVGWRNLSESSQWTSSRVSFRNDAKATARGIQVLEQLIVAGLNVENIASPNMVTSNFPLWDYEQHKIPTKSNPYAYLNLFGTPTEDDNRMLEDREERLELFNNRFGSSITLGIHAARKEGGDIGRAAGQFAKTLEKITSED